jgi:hypothetical protein
MSLHAYRYALRGSAAEVQLSKVITLCECYA